MSDKAVSTASATESLQAAGPVKGAIPPTIIITLMIVHINRAERRRKDGYYADNRYIRECFCQKNKESDYLRCLI